MKKKILAITLCVAMLAIMLVTGTMAYFTDTDADTNVFVSGNVDIEQYEHKRGENGNLVELSANDINSALKLMPIIYLGKDLSDTTEAIYPTADNKWYYGREGAYTNLDVSDNTTARNDRWCALWDEPNAVDKMVSVTNTGNNDVYVRTIVAVPYEIEEWVVLGACIPGQTWKYEQSAPGTYLEIDGEKYAYCVYTYIRDGGILKPGESTGASLTQVCMAANATNELIPEKYRNGFKILVVSQAVQADGFYEALEDQIDGTNVLEKGNYNGGSETFIAELALEEAFGKVATNNPWA